MTPPTTPAIPASSSDESSPIYAKYKGWFLEYASYVILDRAVPHIFDGLKPVHRRILHTMHEMDDGRFNKVANVVGAAMRYHPHGDASIGAALVGIAQRKLLIEPQGNFGNLYTGDGAAAPRYIEARLTAFAKEALFNGKTTVWQQSYDGRNKEPVTLPVKFPLVLAEGTEGIAVGLSTKILPHNFNDLCKASIQYLNGKKFKLFPDFHTGGIADFTEYNDGQRGGKVKIRAKIEQRSKVLFAVTEIPFGTNTTALIESILAANAKGKIKIKHIDDNTAEQVEILIHLPAGADTELTLQQLYVLTDCQVTLSPAACVIQDDKPQFLSVSEILTRSTDFTVALLKRELEIRKDELEEQWHRDSLERIFIETKTYNRIEKATTAEEIISEIRKGLTPHIKVLKREVTDEDIVRLSEIRIRRISRYNRDQAQQDIEKIEADIKQVITNLANLTPYAIAWFEHLQKTYGKDHKRKTTYEEIEVKSVADVLSATEKLYVDRAEGFIGLSLKQKEFVTECTTLNDIACIMLDGTLKVNRVADKVFMGKSILAVDIVPPEATPTYYALLYQDKESGRAYAKKFTIGGYTRDKLYELVPPGSRLLFLTAVAKEELLPKVLKIVLDPKASARKKEFDFDLGAIAVGGRAVKGNLVSDYSIKKVS